MFESGRVSILLSNYSKIYRNESKCISLLLFLCSKRKVNVGLCKNIDLHYSLL